MMTVLGCIATEHNIWLVLVAAIVCSCGAWATMSLFHRAYRTSGQQHAGWLFLTAVAAGASIWSTHFIAKPPKVGKATPWHEDSTYWNGRVSTMAGICTVWLALDRATKDNGCMAVIPGTHDNGFSQYIPVDTNQNIFPTEIDPTQIDESKAVYLELEPNRCSLHEGRIIHGAKPNTSDTRRAGYTIRFFPTTSKVFPERNQGHKIWLARGMDHAGNIYEN